MGLIVSLLPFCIVGAACPSRILAVLLAPLAIAPFILFTAYALPSVLVLSNLFHGGSSELFRWMCPGGCSGAVDIAEGADALLSFLFVLG